MAYERHFNCRVQGTADSENDDQSSMAIHWDALCANGDSERRLPDVLGWKRNWGWGNVRIVGGT